MIEASTFTRIVHEAPFHDEGYGYDVFGLHPPSLARVVEAARAIFAQDTGSQLWDYLRSRVCLRPLGFDPMINVLSLDESVAAVRAPARGVFNIAGFDTPPLARAIVESRRMDVPVPGLLMAPLYTLRRALAGFDFRYELKLRRFHFGGLLDGTRARSQLGYSPVHPVSWPTAWWHVMFERLARKETS